MAGEYSRLVILAQADQDAAHRQLAMDQLALIGPNAGGTSTPRADAMAAAVTGGLYPPAAGQPDTDQRIAALIASYQEQARAAVLAATTGAPEPCR